MIGLYEYDTATEQECLDDFYDILQALYDEGISDDLDALKRRGIRIQKIAED